MSFRIGLRRAAKPVRTTITITFDSPARQSEGRRRSGFILHPDMGSARFMPGFSGEKLGTAGCSDRACPQPEYGVNRAPTDERCDKRDEGD